MAARTRHLARLTPGLLALALAITSCGAPAGSPDATDPARWVLSNVHIETYPTARGLVRLAEMVAADPELSERLTLDLQLGGVLGNEKETLEKLRFGGLEMACTSAAPLAEFAPVVGVLSLPFLFDDSDHLWRVLASPVGEEISAGLEEAGFVPLAWYDAGARSFYNRRRPVRAVEDLVGLKIRVQRSEVMRDMVTALGASPVALGFKQVYTSLHTGAIDGAENNLPSYRSERHFEAAPYYSLDRHAMIPDVVLVAREAWRRLDPASQERLREVAIESARDQRTFWAEYEELAIREVTAAGSEIVEIDDPAAFRKLVEPVYSEHAGRYGDLVSRIRAPGNASPGISSDGGGNRGSDE
jgi:tripartite ATP-independent transporter DctP family solute receptor